MSPVLTAILTNIFAIAAKSTFPAPMMQSIASPTSSGIYKVSATLTAANSIETASPHLYEPMWASISLSVLFRS